MVYKAIVHLDVLERGASRKDCVFVMCKALRGHVRPPATAQGRGYNY